MENYNTKIREETKTPALSSVKLDKHKYLTGKKILASNRNQVIEQAKFTCSHSRNVLENEHKNRLML